MRIVISGLSSATSRELASISDWFISDPLFVIGGNTHNDLYSTWLNYFPVFSSGGWQLTCL